VEIYVSQFLLFMLILARVTSLLVVAPVFGHQTVPLQLKVGLGAFLSFVLFPIVASQAPQADVHLAALVIMVLREVIVGLIIGFSISLIFGGVRLAGELIGFDMGLSIASVYDPENGQNMPMVSEFLYLVTMLVFLVLNGHHFVIESLQLSYTAVPLGEFSIGGPLAEKMVSLGGYLFVIGVKFAAPVIVAGFLMNVVLSILARVMPQMNIFALSFPLKIGVGAVVLMTTAPLVVYAFKHLLAGFESNIIELIKVM